MKLRIKNTTLTLLIIGWFQLIGAIFGFGLLAYLMLNTGALNGPLLLIFCVGIFLFSFSIYSGKSLIWDKDKISGIICSIINQFLQLFQWTILGSGIAYNSGAAITVGVNKSASNFNFGAAITNYSMEINSEGEFTFKINLVALLILIILLDILREIKLFKRNKEENILKIDLTK